MRIGRPSEGVCVTCGRVLDNNDKHTQCLDCRIEQKALEEMSELTKVLLKLRYEKPTKEREEAKKEKRLNPNFHANEKLDRDAKEAQEQGLSYGKWRMKQFIESQKRR